MKTIKNVLQELDEKCDNWKVTLLSNPPQYTILDGKYKDFTKQAIKEAFDEVMVEKLTERSERDPYSFHCGWEEGYNQAIQDIQDNINKYLDEI